MTSFHDQLTMRQAEFLTFILTRIEERQAPPTNRELCDRFGIRQHSSVQDHLLALERKGCLVRDAKQVRHMHVTGKGRRLLEESAAQLKQISLLVAG